MDRIRVKSARVFERRCAYLALILVSLFGVHVLHAQASASLAPNERIRVTAAYRDLKLAHALFMREQGDSLTIQLVKRNETLTLHRGELTKLQVIRGRKHQTVAGAATGFLLGAIVGGVAGAFSTDDSCDPNAGFACVADQVGAAYAPIGGAIAGGLVGLVIGAIIGRVQTTDKWESVPLVLDVGGLGSSDGARATLGVRLSF